MSAFDVRDPASLRDVLDQINLPVYTIAGIARISPSELGRIARGAKVPSNVQIRKLEPALAALLDSRRSGLPTAPQDGKSVPNDERPAVGPGAVTTQSARQGRPDGT